MLPAVSTSPPLLPSLLRALVEANGDALVLPSGARPYLVAAGGRVELGTRDLPVDVIDQLVEQLLPTAVLEALDESGAVAYVLPRLAPFAEELFTVVATGGDDVRVVIQRRRGDTEPRVGTPASAARPASTEARRWCGGTPRRRRRTTRFPPVVLLIDDSPDQLDLYEMALRDVYQVHLAERGETGVKLAIADPPDVAVVDLDMPGVDGWEVCRRLQAHPQTATVPLIILTGRDVGGLRDAATRVGAADLLTKPCSVDTLREHINAVLDR
jgi:CheY-like chemotaxis protein